ncbi:YjdJ family protein [Bacillus sp. DX1.1]|uniref:YjdJ family protein n=1 Tax=unclassified Bacillus (in: firmicutes) TaxID=185979 RepID=UPI00256FD03B|nr:MULTISPECIES: YjdJ family protein [unclassified Bacillus (in: firmicutes)]MDM5154932.1 YjdJ family protein [Bacillus sp. DX1.1]WJE84078.1 YjdJ family protein [Bacillus sp. DX3.1]
MEVIHIVQVGIAFLVWICTTLISWYEGSKLLDNPWEWKYTAKFTKFFLGHATNEGDILQLDFFIYSAKFIPLPFFMMIISFCYMLLVMLHVCLKAFYFKKIIEV